MHFKILVLPLNSQTIKQQNDMKNSVHFADVSVLVANNALGIYAGQHIAQSYPFDRFNGMKEDDYNSLLAGPDDAGNYVEALSELTQSILTHDGEPHLFWEIDGDYFIYPMKCHETIDWEEIGE